MSKLLEYAKQRRAAGASDATVMLELSARGASPDEAEDLVRSLGARFTLDAHDQAAALAARARARRMLGLGVGAVVLGIAVLFLIGPGVMGGGRTAVVSGGLIVWGLATIGRNIGTT